MRELQNVIERAVIMCSEGRIQFDGLNGEQVAEPMPVLELCSQASVNSFLTEERWMELESENLRAALRRAGGKVGGPGGAAELLGIRPTTLRSRLRARDIQPSQ